MTASQLVTQSAYDYFKSDFELDTNRVFGGIPGTSFFWSKGRLFDNSYRPFTDFDDDDDFQFPAHPFSIDSNEQNGITHVMNQSFLHAVEFCKIASLDEARMYNIRHTYVCILSMNILLEDIVRIVVDALYSYSD